MTAPKTIRVTADHIANGVQQDGTACPIARAIREQWPAVREVMVDMGGIYVQADGHTGDITGRVPGNAARFIEDFDSGGEVEPFEFDVEWITRAGVPPQ